MLSIIESGRAKYTYSKMHGVWRVVGAHCLRVQPAVLVDEHRLARRHVAHELEAEHVERDASEASMYSAPLRRLALAEHQRPDAVRIAERRAGRGR